MSSYIAVYAPLNIMQTYYTNIIKNNTVTEKTFQILLTTSTKKTKI